MENASLYGKGYLKTKEQPKKFNLFDTSTTSKPNIYAPILNRGPVSFQTPKSIQSLQSVKTGPSSFQVPESIQKAQQVKPQVARIGTQTQAGDKDLIQTFLDDSKGKKELESRRNAVIEMIKNQEDTTFIEDTIVNKMGYTGIKPKEQGFLGGVAEKTGEAFMGGLGRIKEAGVGLAEGKYDFGEAAVRGGAGALQSTFSPITGALGQTIETVVPDSFKEYIATKTKPTVEDVKTWYNSQSPEQKRRLDNIGVGVELLANFVGAKGVQKTVETAEKTLDKVGDVGEYTGKQIMKGGKVIIEKPKKIMTSIKESNKLKDVGKLEKEVGKVIQGETTDIKPAIETLKTVDTKGVKTYKDLLGKVDEKQKNILALQDNLLQKEGGQYGITNTKKVIETPLGKKEVNYVGNAIDDIKREIDVSQTFDDYNKPLFGKDKTLGEVISKVENNEASLEDLNDLARYYNGQFRDKIYTKTGEAKDSILATKYEANRTGIKNFVRDNLPTDELKQLDKQYGHIAETKRLLDKVNEGVNKLEQKVKERGLLERGARGVAKLVDIASMGTIRGFFTGLLPSNIGNKINNFIDIQGDLSKHLENINKLLDKKDLNIQDIKNLSSNLPKNGNINNTIRNMNNTKVNAGLKTPNKIVTPKKPNKIIKEGKIDSKKEITLDDLPSDRVGFIKNQIEILPKKIEDYRKLYKETGEAQYRSFISKAERNLEGYKQELLDLNIKTPNKINNKGFIELNPKLPTKLKPKVSEEFNPFEFNKTEIKNSEGRILKNPENWREGKILKTNKIDNKIIENFKKSKNFENDLGELLYKLNKKAKAFGKKSVYEDYGPNDPGVQQQLYGIKNNIIKKYGKKTGEWHSFEGGGIGQMFKVGGNEFHIINDNLGYLKETNKNFNKNFDLLKNKLNNIGEDTNNLKLLKVDYGDGYDLYSTTKDGYITKIFTYKYPEIEKIKELVVSEYKKGLEKIKEFKEIIPPRISEKGILNQGELDILNELSKNKSK